MVDLVFADLPSARRREVVSAVAHYIAGVLAWEAMAQMVETMWQSSTLTAGMRVKTLRGTAHGVVLRVLEDGRIVWRTDGGAELIALPESLALLHP